MPLETDFNTTPYHDDFDKESNFYKVLFKPGYSVQTRELNALQSILQQQIEKFGDNILVRGTILDGCGFIHYNPQPYIKLNDLQNDGATPAIPSSYHNLNIISPTTGLTAQIVDTDDGFESSDPDLKTLYINYINSGDDGNVSAFTAGEALEVFDYHRLISKVDITNGGVGFANSDSMVATSALVINVQSGSFTNGVYINDGALANVQIINIDTTTLATSGQQIWAIKPRDVDLANSSAVSTAWTVSNNAAIADAGATATATVERIIGSGFEGSIITNAVGKITGGAISSPGSGYSTAPTVTVRSPDNTSGIAALDLTALNYSAKPVVATVSGAVGNGYSFGITRGTIYQKGYFLEVEPQRITVSKYDVLPDDIAVGFTTDESIINSDQDPELLDNATGSPNDLAPGADRLQLRPRLVALATNVASSDAEFFTLAEFSAGRAFKQNKTTQYNKIQDEMAIRTRDESGDYVLDKFLTATSSPANTAEEAIKYSLKVDPGSAYIDGYRVRTVDVYSTDLNRATATQDNIQRLSLNYGNYVVIKEVGGLFQFSTGDTVDLYDTATGFVTNTVHVATGNITPVGNIIGTARIRSMVSEGNLSPEASQVGAGDAQSRLYLFDINMNAGKNFVDTLGIHYSAGTYEGIADVVTVTQGSTNNQIAELADRQRNRLIFNAGVSSIHNANQISYVYRTIDETTAMSNNGVLVKSIAATPNEYYNASGLLSNSSMLDIYVAPIAADLVAADSLTGTTNYGTGSNVVTGTGSAYLDELVAGDYITVYANSTSGTALHQVTKVTNTTSIQLDRVGAFANSVATIRRTFPKHIPIPFGTRDGLSGNVDSGGNILSLTMEYENANDFNIDSATSVNTAVAVDIVRTAADRKTKTANRTKYVKISLANNAGSTSGPWCIGVPDAFRMRDVYTHTDSTVNTNSTSIRNQFYIDHNQNENFYGLSYLYLNPRNNLTLTSGDWFLIEFDYFTESGAGGFFDPISYVSSNTTQRLSVDSTALSGLGANIHSFEIPQVVSDSGRYYDMINHFDFRPYVETTATPAATAGAAPVNPTETISFGNTADPANDKKFPLPDGIFTANVSQFLSRIDSVFITKTSNVVVTAGVPTDSGLTVRPAVSPTNALRIDDIYIPPYPNVPFVQSEQFKEIVDLRLANIQKLSGRLSNRIITRPAKSFTSTQLRQPRGYSMSDIGRLDSRIGNLEYYVGLTLIESNLKDRTIPSHTDPNLDRHKFGFFVDDFADFDKLDEANPRFAADIEDDDLVPDKMSWIGYFDHNCIGAYVCVDVIEQLNSSEPADQPEPECLPDTQIANTFAYRTKFDIKQVGNVATSYVDSFKLRFASGAQEISPGTVDFVNSAATVYFYAYDKDIKVEVLQGDTVLATTANASALTTAEKTRMTSAEASRWFNDDFTVYGIDAVVSSGYAKYMGKIEVTHNPNLGRDYTIRTTKGTDSHRWKIMVEHPIDRSTVGCPPPPQVPPPASYPPPKPPGTKPKPKPRPRPNAPPPSTPPAPPPEEFTISYVPPGYVNPYPNPYLPPPGGGHIEHEIGFQWSPEAMLWQSGQPSKIAAENAKNGVTFKVPVTANT